MSFHVNMQFKYSATWAVICLCATAHNWWSAQLPVLSEGNGVQDEKTSFESWPTNRTAWQHFWGSLSLRWPTIQRRFQSKCIKPSTFRGQICFVYWLARKLCIGWGGAGCFFIHVRAVAVVKHCGRGVAPNFQPLTISKRYQLNVSGVRRWFPNLHQVILAA